MTTGWGEIINTIGFGLVYKDSWTGQDTTLKSVGFFNDYLLRVVNDGGVLENVLSLLKNVKKLFAI